MLTGEGVGLSHQGDLECPERKDGLSQDAVLHRHLGKSDGKDVEEIISTQLIAGREPCVEIGLFPLGAEWSRLGRVSDQGDMNGRHQDTMRPSWAMRFSACSTALESAASDLSLEAAET